MLAHAMPEYLMALIAGDGRHALLDLQIGNEKDLELGCNPALPGRNRSLLGKRS